MAKTIDWLLNNIEKVNLVPDIDDNTLSKISGRVLQGYDLDESSRYDWKKKTEDGIKVAKQIADKKTFPWQGAANIKFPLIATASIQFAARAYPQIINGQDIVKTSVIGSDPTGMKEARAKRISQHMSWQLLEQMQGWEENMDQLLHGLPVMGTYFKKTYFDTLLQRNVSLCLNPFDVVVNIKHKGSIETCRRITHKLFLYRNEVIERELAGIYEKGVNESFDTVSDDLQSTQELFLEQHCWYDLDGDGYEEPYIVTAHYTSGKIARIVANYDYDTVNLVNGKITRITPIEYFTMFVFIPDPEGDFYGIGFAHLLGPINEAMSTLINQLLDAGSLSNTGGGFVSKGLRWNGGRLNFDLGEWKPVDTTGISLKDSILPLPIQQPSQVLFQLLGLLNESGQKLAAVSDSMSGEMPSQNTPATTVLAMIEQGLKVFTSIYKRVYRSLKSEFKKLYRLNSIYMEEQEYFRVLDDSHAVFREDYMLNDLDVAPVADPTMSSEAQKLARANALLQTLQMNPLPEGKAEILYQYYDSIGAKNLDKLMPMQKIQQMSENPPPNPDMIRIELETQRAKDDFELKTHELEQKHMESIAKIMKIEADIDLVRAQTVKSLADAEAVEPGTQLKQYLAYLEDMKVQQQHERELKKIEFEQSEGKEGAEDAGASPSNDVETGTDGLDEPSNNSKSVQSPQGVTKQPTGIDTGGENLESQLSGSDGNANYSQIGQNLRTEFNSGNGVE